MHTPIDDIESVHAKQYAVVEVTVTTGGILKKALTAPEHTAAQQHKIDSALDRIFPLSVDGRRALLRLLGQENVMDTIIDGGFYSPKDMTR